jgi:hypothetical protein
MTMAAAATNKVRGLIVPTTNAAEAAVVEGIDVGFSAANWKRANAVSP